MFSVMDTAGALAVLGRFTARTGTERVPLGQALCRVLAEDVVSLEFVPDFDRSTVDGYAVSARDTFGCSEGLPAPFSLAGRVEMGGGAGSIRCGECKYVPTGGALPSGADAVVMQEHTEPFLDTVNVLSPAAPGQNVIFRGDDVRPNEKIYTAGHKLLAKDIGALAALGFDGAAVAKRPRVGIISTGDELVALTDKPLGATVRDVNTHALSAAVLDSGGEPVSYGIVRDDPAQIDAALLRSVKECDITLISGGSSVGERDMTANIIAAHGEVLCHGIAVKPGKPTLIGDVYGKPVFGLPGHPMAAYMMFHLLCRPLIARMTGSAVRDMTVAAQLGSAVPKNHGREELVPIKLQGAIAEPVYSKSGLITGLSRADGFVRLNRDAEGLPAGADVTVYLF